MVTEYDFYEELKDAVVKGLSGEIENLSARIIERREFEKTDFKLCLAVLCGSVVELRVMADEWYDPAAQKFDFSGLILKIRDTLDKIYDRYGCRDGAVPCSSGHVLRRAGGRDEASAAAPVCRCCFFRSSFTSAKN